MCYIFIEFISGSKENADDVEAQRIAQKEQKQVEMEKKLLENQVQDPIKEETQGKDIITANEY